MPQSKKSRRDVEHTPSKARFIATLRRVADALEQGRSFRLRVAGERVYVPARARFSIEHERGWTEEEVEFQLKWTR
jgi:amphi-Trp domain-containing protein